MSWLLAYLIVGMMYVSFGMQPALSYDEYKELTYNGLIDKVKEYVT